MIAALLAVLRAIRFQIFGWNDLHVKKRTSEVMGMVQGDKYALPVKIQVKSSGGTPTVISDMDVVKVRIKLGDAEDVWPEGTLRYNSNLGKWMFPLTQEETLKMSNVGLQVRIVFPSGDIFNSVPQQVAVYKAIIREVEDE